MTRFFAPSPTKHMTIVYTTKLSLHTNAARLSIKTSEWVREQVKREFVLSSSSTFGYSFCKADNATCLHNAEKQKDKWMNERMNATKIAKAKHIIVNNSSLWNRTMPCISTDSSLLLFSPCFLFISLWTREFKTMEIRFRFLRFVFLIQRVCALFFWHSICW